MQSKEQKTNAELMKFIKGLARMKKDGECLNCQEDADKPNPNCDCHEPWDMPNDDAVDTVHSTINAARELVSRLSK